MYHRTCVHLHKEVEHRVISNQETCPKCNKPITNQSEAVVQGGNMYHRTCVHLHKEAEHRAISNQETCPKCNQVIANQSEAIVQGGRMYHRTCVHLHKDVQQRVASKQDTCPTCGEPITNTAESVISGGVSYHRKCLSVNRPKHISGGSFEISVETDAPDAPLGSATGPGAGFDVSIEDGGDIDIDFNLIFGGATGNWAVMVPYEVVTVVANDTNGQPKNQGGDNGLIEIVGPHGLIPVKTTDNNDGSYSTRFCMYEKGTYNVVGLWNWNVTSNSPFVETISK
eukprot:TRINITY_DN373_c0_g1_i9.p1 TRINITY_DN373_c0_g1~~TRINITY_DN373_c0_g1_i9.p1  ORF type:complete len:283 (+),score=52.65 TRINITY_DN373_c0_g1_i9:443-1291(+)